MIFWWFSWVDFLLANVVWCIIMLWNSIGKSFVNFLAIFFRWSRKNIIIRLMHLSLSYIYIGRSRSGSRSGSSLIAFSAT